MKTFAFLICCAVALVGCSGIQDGQRPGRCAVEGTIVASLDAGITAADASLGDGMGEEAQEALRIASGVATLGRAAVDACEVLRDGGGWQQWVGLALEAAGGLLAHFTGAADGDRDVEAPPELLDAVDLLRAEAEQ